MEAMINQTELDLLAFLHEHAKGYDHHFGFRTDEIEKPLEWDRETFHKVASYLNQWGLISIDSWIGGQVIARISLTGAGEAYMRSVEAELANKSLIERGKRLTLTIVKSAGAAALTVATDVFSEHAKVWLQGVASSVQAILRRP